MSGRAPLSQRLSNWPTTGSTAELLEESDAPTSVQWRRGICIAPEPATINTYVRYAGGRSNISYNQLIAAVSELAFELACGRLPQPKEATASTQFLSAQRKLYAADKQAEQQTWTDFCQMILASNAFLYVE